MDSSDGVGQLTDARPEVHHQGLESLDTFKKYWRILQGADVAKVTEASDITEQLLTGANGARLLEAIEQAKGGE